MEALAPFIGIAAFALVGFVIYRMIAADRKRKTQRAGEAAARGFRPVTPPDPNVVEWIVALHRRPGRKSLEVRELFHRDAGDHGLYLFDLADTSGEDAGLVCHGAVAILAPALRLPRFTLVPQVESEGRLARLTNWIIQRLPTAGGARVEFPQAPAFQQRYALMAEDEAAARAFFKASRLAHLAETRYWMMEGSGQALTLDRLEIGRAGRSGSYVDDRLRDAERAWAIFAPGAW
jgi:hypothetical protein